jgi:hypothetical protein
MTVQQAYVVTGTLRDGKVLTLDEALPVQEGQVRVIVEVVSVAPKPSFTEVMEQLWEDQRKRGHKPRTAEEIAEFIRADRATWDDDNAPVP